MMDLAGKKVLITGGAKRVGAAIARAFAAKDAKVLIHYRSSQSEAKVLAKELGLAAHSLFQADLSKKNQIDRMTAKIRREWGGVDVLVNSASVFYPTAFSKISEKDWAAYVSLHITAPFYLAQALAPGMKRKGGRIVNIADWVFQKPLQGYLPYSVSKAGLLALTEALAKILAPEVLVTAVCPGPVLAPKEYGTEIRKKIAKTVPLGRWGTPEDIARMVVFLAESDFITGSFHPVDGGARLS
jgi:pteridine reductase